MAACGLGEFEIMGTAMKFLPVIAAFALASFGALLSAPASAQSMMKDFSFAEMRTALAGLNVTVTKEEQDGADGARYLTAKDKGGLVFFIYGQQCTDKTPTQRCRGAEIFATFDFDDADDIPDALEEIDYVAVDDDANDEDGVRMTRYLIFDEGITPGNLRVNLEVFLSITNKVWKYLDEEGYLS
jgi:hypothetical protein